VRESIMAAFSGFVAGLDMPLDSWCDNQAFSHNSPHQRC
jgi:hypothetical protein